MQKIVFFILFLLVSANGFAADSVFKILEKYQFTNEETMDIMARYDELVDTKFIFVKPMQSIDGSLKLKLFSENKQDEFIIEKSDNFVEVEKIPSALTVEPQFFEGEIKGDIYETIMRDFQDEKLAIFLSNAFSEEFSTTKG